jgi:DNA modification methylase
VSWEIVNADVMDWAAEYDGPPFHAMLADAPYEMAFMNREWDDSGVSFDPRTWEALARHLLPGAFMFVFAGTINDDLISVAMRKAELRKHHKVFVWLQAQGFPKSQRIDTQIDKAAGVERPDKIKGGHIGVSTHGGDGPNKNEASRRERLPRIVNKGSLTNGTPVTPLAATWEGHRYGLQSLKPCAESILLFQKPYANRPVEDITATGAGALWIDGGRIGGGDPANLKRLGRDYTSDNTNFSPMVQQVKAAQVGGSVSGRWPPNFALCHIAPDENGEGGCRRVGTRRVKDCNASNDKRGSGSWFGGDDGGKRARPKQETVAAYQCAPGCPVAALGEQSGETGNGYRRNLSTQSKSAFHGNKGVGERGHNDKGTAARFYLNADWSYEVAEQLTEADAVRYQSKAAKRERNSGLNDFCWRRNGKGHERITREEWEQLPEKERAQGNIHNTVKPISLVKWIATLLAPPPEYAPRRLLVPFSGSGSEMIAAVLSECWETVVGIEMIPAYCDIAESRLTWWEQAAAGVMFNDVKEILKQVQSPV